MSKILLRAFFNMPPIAMLGIVLGMMLGVTAYVAYLVQDKQAHFRFSDDPEQAKMERAILHVRGQYPQ